MPPTPFAAALPPGVVGIGGEGPDDARWVFLGILTVNRDLAHFPQVQAWLDTASPTDYCVRGFRRRAAGSGRELSAWPVSLETADIWVRCTERRERVALQVAFAKHIDTAMWSYAKNMTLVLLDHVVGEWDAAVKVGAVDFGVDPAEDAVPL